MTHTKRTNWANVLTWSRLVLTLPITIAAFFAVRWLVCVLFIIAQLTDFFDGKVSRWTGMASANGALLDSRIDNVFLLFVVVWVWLLFPAVMTDFVWWIAILLALIAMNLVIAYRTLGVVTGLHLWSNKLGAGSIAVSLPLLIIIGYAPWIIWTVIIIGFYAAADVTIYLLKGGKNLDARFFWDE